MKTFSIGDCLSTAITTWLKLAPRLMLLQAAIDVPGEVIARLASEATTDERLRLPMSVATSTVWQFLAGVPLTAAGVLIAVRRLGGEKQGLVAACRVAVRRLPSLWGVAFAVEVRIVALAAVCASVGLAFAYFDFESDPKIRFMLGVAIAVSVVLLSGLVVRVLVLYCAAIPAVLCEGRRASGALIRSRALTVGRRFQLWSCGVVLAIAGIVAECTRALPSTGFRAAVQFVGPLLFGSMIPAAIAVAYCALRIDKEGIVPSPQAPH